MAARKQLPPLRRAKAAPTSSGSTPSPAPAPHGSATASQAAPAPKLLVLCVPDERLARLIGTKIRAFTLGPDLGEVPVVVVASSDPHSDETAIATALARIGANHDDLRTAFPRIQIGFPDPD